MWWKLLILLETLMILQEPNIEIWTEYDTLKYYMKLSNYLHMAKTTEIGEGKVVQSCEEQIQVDLCADSVHRRRGWFACNFYSRREGGGLVSRLLSAQISNLRLESPLPIRVCHDCQFDNHKLPTWDYYFRACGWVSSADETNDGELGQLFPEKSYRNS